MAIRQNVNSVSNSELIKRLLASKKITDAEIAKIKQAFIDAGGSFDGTKVTKIKVYEYE